MKSSVKKHVMNATSEAVQPQIERLEQRVDELMARIEDLQMTLQRLESVEDMLVKHLPRPNSRPGFLAQYNVADLLAWRAADTSAAFIEENMPTARMLDSRHENIVLAAADAPTEGMILEFGVGSGESLRWLEGAFPDRRIVGFDSFEGLPEDWRTGFEAGAFADANPPGLAGAELRIGWFEDTLPAFLAEVDEPIALLHVDCDLYSSTKTVFDNCGSRLAQGAIVVFDEFFNYHGWQQHEAKAWAEYLRENSPRVDYLSYVPSWEQVTVRVTP